MKDKLIEVLSQIGYPPILQGTLPDDEPLPDTFITYWTNDSTDAGHGDGLPFGTIWNATVNVYSNDPLTLEQVARESRQALKSAGFITSGEGHDLPSGEPSHTGKTQDYDYLEINI